jgi:hypothetical protein
MRRNIGVMTIAVMLVSCSVNTIGRGIGENKIVRVVEFELSPDEGKIALAALTPIGNTDIWVVDIDGKNLKRLTFKDRSPTNRIAQFFRKHRWRNFFEIDMKYPRWTKEGKIMFCQRLTKYDMWGKHIVSFRYWIINPDGTGKRHKKSTDKTVQAEAYEPINRAIVSVQSHKHKKQILLKDGILWALNNGESIPQKLIQ